MLTRARWGARIGASWPDPDAIANRLERTLPFSFGMIAAGLAAAWVLDLGSQSYLSCALITTLMMVPFLLPEPAPSRRTFLALWALAYGLRVVLLVAIFQASVAAGGPFLGKDSTQFFRGSRVMADRAFSLGAHPIAVFETYDVAHYYIYAFLMRAFDADLFALQLFNSGLTALAAPLMFSVARTMRPRWAVWFGLLVALNPSVIVLSIKDLLKDPSVLFAASVALWSLVHMCRPARWMSRIAYGVVAILALSYLHMDRFYVAAYLEIAAALLLIVLVWKMPHLVRRDAVAAVAIAFAASEALPIALGWQSSPTVMLEQVRFVTRTSGMLRADAGMTERALRARLALKGRPSAKDAHGRDVQTIPDASEGAAGSYAAAAIKRYFGPFVWVLPPRWTLREILGGDYLLYPGTLVWYVVLPLAAIGIIAVMTRVAAGVQVHPVLIGLCIFCLLYFAQYTIVNLSFRQRDVMFPYVAMFAFIGYPLVSEADVWRRLFVWYWIALASLAVVHLTVRAFA